MEYGRRMGEMNQLRLSPDPVLSLAVAHPALEAAGVFLSFGVVCV